MRGLSLDADAARRAVRAVGVVGTVLGVGAMVAPERGLRPLGVELGGRGGDWMARLFGCRDTMLGLSLLRLSAQERPETSWLDALALAQAGDVAVTLALWRAGRLTRRGLLSVLLTAPPTLLAALAARRALSPASASSAPR